jgi:hypothetical protein
VPIGKSNLRHRVAQGIEKKIVLMQPTKPVGCIAQGQPRVETVFAAFNPRT